MALHDGLRPARRPANGGEEPVAPYAPCMMELDAVEARVIGSLAEKQLTTPQQYPLTLNALVLACNQSSNREPVVAYDEGMVEIALSSLKDAGLLRFVHPSHGRSVTRYRQVIDERLSLSSRGLALLAVLLLRGPQTLGELRTRTERMADFADLGDVEAELALLGELADPLVRRLPRQSGHKEERWAQLLTGEPPMHFGRTEATDATEVPGGPRSVPVRDEVASLRGEVDVLRAEMGALRGELAALTADLGGLRSDLGAG
jgi:uncharacterized protein YceH (UPF0502 family)